MARSSISSIIGAPAWAVSERACRFDGLAEPHLRMLAGRLGNGEHQD